MRRHSGAAKLDTHPKWALFAHVLASLVSLLAVPRDIIRSLHLDTRAAVSSRLEFEPSTSDGHAPRIDSAQLSSAVMLVVGPALAAVRSLRRHKQAKQAMRDDDKLLLDISVHSAASTSCSSSTSDSSERVGWHPHPPVGRWGRYAVSANDPGQVAAVSASQASCDEWYRRQITY